QHICCSGLLSYIHTRGPPRSPLFPYTTLFRSTHGDLPDQPVEAGPIGPDCHCRLFLYGAGSLYSTAFNAVDCPQERAHDCDGTRSEEHTSELQSRENLVCRLLLEKKKK